MQSFIIDIIKTYGPDIIWIVLIFFLGRFTLKRIVRRAVRLAAARDGESKSKLEKRTKTLGSIIITTGNIIIYVIVLLMILNLFGVNIAPILAGVGIIGLAVGFGAQSLVKDFVSGLFILIENQYNIGDKVKIGTLEGRVIKITMRSTILRDEEGKTLYLSNGSVNNVINFSQASRK